MKANTLFRHQFSRSVKSRVRKRRRRELGRRLWAETLEDRRMLAGILSVVPDSATPGAEDLLVTLTLESNATPPPPPSIVAPTSATIGTIEGSALTRNAQEITATFDIPADEATGAKDVAMSFPTPFGTITYTLPGGFNILDNGLPIVTIMATDASATEAALDTGTFTITRTGSTDGDLTVPLSLGGSAAEGDDFLAMARSGVIPDGQSSVAMTLTPVDDELAEPIETVTLTISADEAYTIGTDGNGAVRIADNDGGVVGGTYTVVDTGQTAFYNNWVEIAAPAEGDAFYGQDAGYDGNLPSYTLSADGLTVYDNVTGLTWTQSPDLDGDGDIDASDKLTFNEFQTYANTLNAQNFGGYSDWRAPTIKELYSLIDFSGEDPSGYSGTDTSGIDPFIDTDYFEFGFGDTSAGERIIDAQFWSSNECVSGIFEGQDGAFGVNFADGRIKGYPSGTTGRFIKTEYAYFVRGNTDYGLNQFFDNSDGTITDNATGLMWSQDDSGSGMNWEVALAWVEQLNAESHLGYNDWRLPNAKELQSIVDYSRSPDTTNSAAIDPVFNVTSITDEGGDMDYPYYWSGTTHANWLGGGQSAAYLAFGEADGYMNRSWMDVHGAGAQRSDPKQGDAGDYPFGHGPQGDAIRIDNFVRVVRDANTTPTPAPEIQVLDATTNIPDGTGIVAFGSTTVGAAFSKTFTVMNVGTSELMLTPPIFAPAGFRVPSGFGTNRLAAGESTTFTVQLDATAPGTYSGTLSFTNDDSDENPFDFAVSGTVTGESGAGMTIEQTLSDEAQRNTIAFDGLAFLTGSLGADSFLPPGKVADFWGFQYLRDNDPSEMGHNTDFLTKAANNVLYVLTDSQIAELVALAEGQIDDINQYAYDRFVLMDAFRRLLNGDLPQGSSGLDPEAVKAYSAQLYGLDGEISLERAQAMGGILNSLTDTQRAHLDSMVGQGMTSWPDVPDQLDPRDYTHDAHVAVMTYAGDLFSWYAGSVDADVYFCPERQGTYFGSFYLKDAPAMGNPNYSIDPNLTAESGAAFLAALTADQAQTVTNLVGTQREDLYEIVDRRSDVATELRRFIAGDAADRTEVLALMERYGELDGEIVYQYANAFAAVGQDATLASLRAELGVTQPDGAYLYSEPIDMPEVPNSDFLFTGVVSNDSPNADAGGPYSGSEGDTIPLSGSESTDADGTISLYEWDLDNNGEFDDATGAAAAFQATAVGTLTVGLRVTDDDGATDTDTATLNIGQVTAAFEGYTLFAPMGSRETYLIDNDGAVVHSWSSDYASGTSEYLLEDGTLVRTAKPQGPNQWFNAGGATGRVEQWSWGGDLLWEFEYSNGYHRLHHDIEVLPNGNVLMIAWEWVDGADAIAAGRDPSLLTDGELWPDHIIEIEPTGSSGGDIVWEWHAWDHLVQDYDSSKDSYGVVADHPELIDVNYVSGRESADWNHTNSIDYNSDLDQILLSVRSFNEIWVIDHSTTSEEAAGHTGGDLGMGGDLLYRWGNPQAYDTGTADDQVFFGQHDAEWIGDGIPGEDNILVFNNGTGRSYSSVDEIDTPLAADGSYTIVAGQPYGPDDLTWSYTAEPATSFYADHISGSQRRANGNTLVTNGTGGTLFEVTISGEIVWEYDAGGQVFRADRYAPDYAGFDGTPLDDNPVNQTPLADAGGPYRGDAGTTIALSGLGSSDSDGSISLYEWDLDNDGQYDDATGATAEFNAATAGTFTVGLRVTDDDGAQDIDTATLNIAETGGQNQAPYLAHPIPNQAARANRKFRLRLRPGTFADPDADQRLGYAATLADGSPLPRWLKFNGQTKTLSGRPRIHDVGQYDIRVTATDSGSPALAAWAEFTIDVTPHRFRYQNADVPADVDGSEAVTPLDALILVNWINGKGSGSVPSSTPESADDPLPFLDVSGDDIVSPVDVLMVVGQLNVRPPNPGEGESVQQRSPSSMTEQSSLLSMPGVGSQMVSNDSQSTTRLPEASQVSADDDRCKPTWSVDQDTDQDTLLSPANIHGVYASSDVPSHMEVAIAELEAFLPDIAQDVAAAWPHS